MEWIEFDGGCEFSLQGPYGEIRFRYSSACLQIQSGRDSIPLCWRILRKEAKSRAETLAAVLSGEPGVWVTEAVLEDLEGRQFLNNKIKRGVTWFAHALRERMQ